MASAPHLARRRTMIKGFIRDPNGPLLRTRGARIEIESAAMDVDRRLEVLDVPISAGALLDGLDGGVDALADGVGDAVRVVREDVVQVALDHLGNLEDSGQARPHRPRVPARMEGLCGLARATVPEVAQHLLDGPGSARLEH